MPFEPTRKICAPRVRGAMDTAEPGIVCGRFCAGTALRRVVKGQLSVTTQKPAWPLLASRAIPEGFPTLRTLHPFAKPLGHQERPTVSPAFAVGAALWKRAGLSFIIEEYTANAPLEGLPMRLASDSRRSQSHACCAPPQNSPHNPLRCRLKALLFRICGIRLPLTAPGKPPSNRV